MEKVHDHLHFTLLEGREENNLEPLAQFIEEFASVRSYVVKFVLVYLDVLSLKIFIFSENFEFKRVLNFNL